MHASKLLLTERTSLLSCTRSQPTDLGPSLGAKSVSLGLGVDISVLSA